MQLVIHTLNIHSIAFRKETLPLRRFKIKTDLLLSMKQKIEILAPAKNLIQGIAAINAGADAVYIAGQQYGARAFAKNFTMEEIEKAVEYAHLNGVKVHVTVNTLINNFEISLNVG